MRGQLGPKDVPSTLIFVIIPGEVYVRMPPPQYAPGRRASSSGRQEAACAAGHGSPALRSSARRPAAPLTSRKLDLLDLRFLELDVLTGDRIIFLERELLGLGAGVLLGDVEIAGVGGRQ